MDSTFHGGLHSTILCKIQLALALAAAPLATALIQTLFPFRDYVKKSETRFAEQDAIAANLWQRLVARNGPDWLYKFTEIEWFVSSWWLKTNFRSILSYLRIFSIDSSSPPLNSI